MKVLVFTNLYPNTMNPEFGVFIKNRTVALQSRADVEIKVVAPVPYFPPINISQKWYRYSKIPRREDNEGIEVYHPRYLVTPKVGMSFYGVWMFLGVIRTIIKLRKNFPFDVIDAHFLYPDGFAAILLGRFFKCPVMVTGRGSDITVYTRLPYVRHLVDYVLKRATHLVSVSASLRDVMFERGVAVEDVSVIPNGINPGRFYELDKAQARERLSLPPAMKILLTVCSLVELKGVHLLINAVSRVKEQYPEPFQVLIVGQGPDRERLQAQIIASGLEHTVRLVGSIQNSDLVYWYNAADLFFLGSSREGWPNVVCEALACGTPVVATNVNGIPEILNDQRLGLMVERNTEGFACGIVEAFSTDWDTDFIVSRGQQRTWDNVAGEVDATLRKLIAL